MCVAVDKEGVWVSMCVFVYCISERADASLRASDIKNVHYHSLSLSSHHKHNTGASVKNPRGHISPQRPHKLAHSGDEWTHTGTYTHTHTHTHTADGVCNRTTFTVEQQSGWRDAEND